MAVFREAPVSAVLNQKSLSAASTDETIGAELGQSLVSGLSEIAAYISWGSGVTAGAVSVETANEAGYTGTWAVLATVTFSGTAPKQDVVQVTGAHGAIRTRVETAVANGTVTTWFVGR